MAETWRRPKGVRLLHVLLLDSGVWLRHVLLLGGEGRPWRTERCPGGVRWALPELNVACPRIVVLRLRLGLRADVGVAGRLLLVAAASATSAAGPLLALAALSALAGLTIASCSALAVAALAALPMAAVRQSGWGTRCGNESGRCGGGQWIRGPSGLAGSDVIDVDLLKQEKRASLLEGGEGLPHLEVGDHGSELAAEAAEEGEDQSVVPSQIAVVTEGRRHGLETAVEVGDRGRALFRRAKLRREQQGARFALAEKLILEVCPGAASFGLVVHRRLLEISMDGAVDPSEHGAVHLHPRRTIGVYDVGEDVIREGIFAQDCQEHSAPPVVVVCGVIQDQGHEDGDGGGMDSGVLGFVRVEGRGTIGLHLAAAPLLGVACSTSVSAIGGRDPEGSRTGAVDDQATQGSRGCDP